MEATVLSKIGKVAEQGEKAALIILESNCGSVPGKEGSIMGVFEDGSTIGTVGGGAIEYDLIKRSLEAMKKNENFKFDYSLTEKGELKMACGGQASGFVKIFVPKNKLIIFGGGHCSQKLAKFAVNCNFAVYVVDDREEFKNNSDFDGIVEYLVGTPKEVVQNLSFNADTTYIVMATRGHLHDLDAARVTIDKEYKYMGMLGSKKKAIEVKEQLLKEGYSLEKINNIHLPIGLDISDGSVEEIGISILSEILKVKNNLKGEFRKIEIKNKAT
ncbi:XdhC family protein [Miniphocaeibacter massiliensis]|uniref:XdhC family protein n=1 Tax=Miniphocaeibacter massiliensis TaxID=2041841 RepID=UPI000C1C6602|nr:XdhC/CoxI family protein [Miniphocaeibacter massiliensis]